MTPESIQALQNIAIEAIKILGPATIAAVVAYKIAKTQSDTSLKQIDKRSEFDARKAIHDFLIQQQEKVSQNFKQAGENLGFVMGVTTGVEDNDEDLLAYIDLSNLTLRTVQRQCEATLTQYKNKKLTDTAEYAIVQKCSEAADNLEPADNFDSLRVNSLALMPIYEDLHYSIDAQIERELNEILAPYVDGEKREARARAKKKK